MSNNINLKDFTIFYSVLVYIILYMVVDPGRYWQGKLLQEPKDDSRSNTEAGMRERKRDVEMKEGTHQICGKKNVNLG